MKIDFVKVYKDRLEQVEKDLGKNAKLKKWHEYYRLKKEKENIIKWLSDRENKK